ncbi:RsiV family protein [Chakrabartyella piscis]|uniref:RsiV family protein n=1 Tax=Chakrabartyella piscis TaxID=2918914 RepID=UPI00295867A5|nr:RsiV family protein [Chakrabartyella piscis]
MNMIRKITIMITCMVISFVILTGCQTVVPVEESEVAETSTSTVIKEPEGYTEVVEEVPIKVDTTETIATEKRSTDLIPDMGIDTDDFYKIVVSNDKERGIKRTFLRFEKYNHELYFEIPIITDETDGYQKINDFFNDLQEDFFAEQATEHSSLWTILQDMEQRLQREETLEVAFCDINNAIIVMDTPNIYGVSISYEGFFGGTVGYGMQTYYFDPQTGNPLNLLDVVEETEAELKEMVIAELEQIDIPSGEIYWDDVATLSVAEFDFMLENDEVSIYFDKYEIAAGVYGGVSITIPAHLKAAYMQESMEDLT